VTASLLLEAESGASCQEATSKKRRPSHVNLRDVGLVQIRVTKPAVRAAKLSFSELSVSPRLVGVFDDHHVLDPVVLVNGVPGMARPFCRLGNH
jgi:hypothetical protein